jgi:hypothetical protein
MLFTIQNVELLADTQFLDQGPVSLDILFLQIVEQSTSLADQLQQAAAGVVIFAVSLEMVSQMIDSFAQDCNLDLRGAGVRSMRPVRADNLRFNRFCQGHCPNLLSTHIDESSNNKTAPP